MTRSKKTNCNQKAGYSWIIWERLISRRSIFINNSLDLYESLECLRLTFGAIESSFQPFSDLCNKFLSASSNLMLIKSLKTEADGDLSACFFIFDWCIKKFSDQRHSQMDRKKVLMQDEVMMPANYLAFSFQWNISTSCQSFSVLPF